MRRQKPIAGMFKPTPASIAASGSDRVEAQNDLGDFGIHSHIFQALVPRVHRVNS